MLPKCRSECERIFTRCSSLRVKAGSAGRMPIASAPKDRNTAFMRRGIALSLFLFVVIVGGMTGCEADDDVEVTDTAETPGDGGRDEPDGESYGAVCERNAECAGGLCLAGSCSQYCDRSDANSCTSVDAFCVALLSGNAACAGGPLNLGDDTEDNHVVILENNYTELLEDGDADLYVVDLPAGKFQIFAGPTGSELDIAFDVYGPSSDLLGTENGDGPGDFEAVIVELRRPLGFAIVVRNNGALGGQYTFDVSDCAGCGPSNFPFDGAVFE